MSSDNDYDIPENGAIFTFGRSRFAENLPSHFFVKNDPVTEISCGDDHTALVCKSGRVFLFGRNDYGQLGFGHNKIINKPSCLKYLKPFHSTHVACGKGHTIVSTACNRLFTFGCNSDGQLGTSDLYDRAVPQMVSTDFLTEDYILGIAAGCHHSALLTEKGSVYLWGSNSDGQCGVEGELYLSIPHKIEFNQPITSISCGYYHTAFISLGIIYTFGEEDNGKLGRSRKSSNYEPGKVEIGKPCALVKCGGSHTMALTDDGEVYAFGSNFSGQLGILNLDTECSTPKKLEFSEENGKIVNLSCGESHSAFVSEKGFLYTCGDSRYGKLCNEDESTNQVTPTLIISLENYFCMLVSCGGCHTMVMAKTRSSNNNSDILPPLKTKLNVSVNVKSTKGSAEANGEDNYEKQEKKNENIEDRDDILSTGNNLITENINPHLDDIYTEIKEIMNEKNEDKSEMADLNPNHSNEAFDITDNDTGMVKKENAVNKLLKVFKKKKTITAALMNEKSELKDTDKTKAEDFLKTENQNISRTCSLL